MLMRVIKLSLLFIVLYLITRRSDRLGTAFQTIVKLFRETWLALVQK